MFSQIKYICVLLFLLVVVVHGKYKVDGDGKPFSMVIVDSALDPKPPEGALNYGVTAADIGPESEDLPYDGIDQIVMERTT